MAEERPTVPGEQFLLPAPLIRRFSLVVVEPAAAAVTWTSGGDACTIGSAENNDLVIEQPTVSRFHCQISISPEGARIKDLGSRNGTVVDGVRVRDAMLRDGSTVQLGSASILFRLGTETIVLPISERTQFGSLVGHSVAMRSVFSLLERAASTDATILIEGETGTGKGAAVDSIHRMSKRRGQPLLVADCGAIPANLLESELFGHERGAFTGADVRRAGVFEDADGGTVFLDEIGELPMELQPKLLRVLETKEIKRLGSSSHKPVNVRIIAATNRDLRAEVNQGRFRADLFYRLAVLKITMPPLRQRPDDLPVLAEQVLRNLGASPEEVARLLTVPFIHRLQRGSWPGNVRELRNHLERCLVFAGDGHAVPVGDDGATTAEIDYDVSYAENRRRAILAFERRYVEGLLHRHGDNVTRAAEGAGMTRVHLHRLRRRHLSQD
jgi:transcriptional regulator with PAS, ATPase and Fis domain